MKILKSTPLVKSRRPFPESSHPPEKLAYVVWPYWPVGLILPDYTQLNTGQTSNISNFKPLSVITTKRKICPHIDRSRRQVLRNSIVLIATLNHPSPITGAWQGLG